MLKPSRKKTLSYKKLLPSVNLLSLEAAAEQLQQGQLIAYPTEAVWGLGCDPFHQQAVERLLEIKKRPVEKGLILLVPEISMLAEYLQPLTEQQLQTVSKPRDYPVTWLVPVNDKMPKWVCGQFDTVAIRISQHPLIQQLFKYWHRPLVSSSANYAGDPAAKTLEQAYQYFADDIHYVDGQTLGFDSPSKIIDLVSGKIIRD